MPLEEAMCTAAAAGDLVDRGVGPFELAEMQAWKEERAVRAAVLRYLLVEARWPVHAKGIRLRGIRISGHLDLEAATLRCPLFLDSCYFDSDEPACLDRANASLVAIARCQLAGLTGDGLIARGLDVSHSALTGAVSLAGASITGELNFRCAKLNGQDKEGNALRAEVMKVDGDARFDGVVTTAGAVRIVGANITGQLNFRGAELGGRDSKGYALVTDRMKVGSSMFLDEGFAAAGALRLVRVGIGGQISCRGANLNGRDNDDIALLAEGMNVGADLFLDIGPEGTFTAVGAVRLVGAGITGQLSCRGAKLNGCDGNGNALGGYGMRVGGDASLDEGFTAAGAVRLMHADITGQLNCQGAKLNGRDKEGNALQAEVMKVGGDVLLDKVSADGAVRLAGADITGTLRCRGARLNGRDNHGRALYARGIRVGGDVYLDEEFTADGAVRLAGADITGSLRCNGAKLAGNVEDRYALYARGINVGGDVFLDKITAHGAVRLARADITGMVSFRGAQLTGRDEDGNALDAHGIKVGGHVLLDEEFTASGAVCLVNADITEQLSFSGAQLTGRDKYGNALHGEGIKVGRDVVIDGEFTASEPISLASARAGALRWEPAGQVSAQVNLEGATVGELDDDWSSNRPNGQWPTRGMLRLDRFTYGRFSGDHQATVEQRLEWIRSQYHRPAGSMVEFAAQPYEQLAKVYRQAGQDDHARKVSIARRRDLRKYGNLNLYRRFGNRFLDTTIRYGYHTWRAGVALAVLFLIFWWLSARAQQHHLIAWAGDIPGLRSVPSAARCTSSYPCFYPFGYTVDTVIPLINVHQADFWGPDASTPWGVAFTVATWIATGLGWLLATLLVAGYTGLVRRN
jgi:hypothetical protein